jgi:hypothetical protein
MVPGHAPADLFPGLFRAGPAGLGWTGTRVWLAGSAGPFVVIRSRGRVWDNPDPFRKAESRPVPHARERTETAPLFRLAGAAISCAGKKGVTFSLRNLIE